MNYGEKIRYLRTKVRDLTLLELANKSGLSVSYLSDAELGRSNMSIKALEKVSTALGVSSSYILDSKAVTFEEVLERSDYVPPADVMEFLAKQDKLPYLVLIKEMSDKGLSAEAIKIMFDNIQQMMNAMKK